MRTKRIGSRAAGTSRAEVAIMMEQKASLFRAAFTAAFLIGSLALAQEAATGVVAERMEAMKQITSHMKALDQAMRSEDSSVTSKMREHAEQIHGLTGLFPVGSGHGHTEAKPEIWTHSEEFERIAKSFDVACEELFLAAQSGDRQAMELHFKAVTAACSECHEKVRVPGKR
jgi:cytochrome c556